MRAIERRPMPRENRMPPLPAACRLAVDRAARLLAGSRGPVLLGGPLLLLLVGGALAFWGPRSAPPAKTRVPALQCGHYALLRVCQMLGAPVTDRQLVTLMKPQPQGHSFADLERAVVRLGLKAEGFTENWAALVAGPFPCIVQLRDPEHFVVLTRTDRDRIILFDDLGQRRVAPAAAIQARWTGKLLRIAKPAGWSPPGVSIGSAAAPRAAFETLLIDAGELAHGTPEVEFKYAIANRGSAPLEITQVEVSCQCLSVVHPDSIAPGQQGTITLKYAPESSGAGLIAHEARLATNDPRMPRVRLTALASLRSRVLVHPPHVAFANLAGDSLARGYAAIFYRGDRPEEFQLSPAGPLPRGVSCRLVPYEEFVRAVGATGLFAEPKELERKRFVEIAIDGAAVESAYGRFHGTVRFETGIPHVGQVSVKYSGNLVPAVEARPRILAFRPRGESDAGLDVATVRLFGRQHFRVAAVAEGAFSVRVPDRPAGRPGYELELEVTLPHPRAQTLHGAALPVTLVNAATGRESQIELTVYAPPRS